MKLSFSRFPKPSRSVCIALLLGAATLSLVFFSGIGWSDRRVVKARTCLTTKVAATHNVSELVLALSDIVMTCGDPLLASMNYGEFFGEESKYMLEPVKMLQSCQIVTLGIGQNVGAELALQSRHPSCEFLGVDNDAAVSGVMYTSQLQGRYINALVGVQEGTYEASVLGSQRYEPVILPHMALKQILRNEKITFIDNMLMDIEGAEFGLFEDILKNPNDYPTICQWNVEFHDPSSVADGYRFMDNLLFSIERSPYLLVKAERFSNSIFNRCFFININDPKCVAKFVTGNVRPQPEDSKIPK